MEGLILGVNTLYRLFCFFKLFPMVGKGLTHFTNHSNRRKEAEDHVRSINPHADPYGLMEDHDYKRHHWLVKG